MVEGIENETIARVVTLNSEPRLHREVSHPIADQIKEFWDNYPVYRKKQQDLKDNPPPPGPKSKLSGKMPNPKGLMQKAILEKFHPKFSMKKSLSVLTISIALYII